MPDADAMAAGVPMPDPDPAAEARNAARLSTERRLAGLIAERDRRLTRPAYDDGFAAGVKVGRVEAAAEHLDQLGPVIGHTEPSTYDLAVEALHAAVRLVNPVKAASLLLDDEIGPVSLAYARLTTTIADELVRWLSEHVDVEPQPIHDEVNWAIPDLNIAMADRCTSCGSSVGFHFAGCTVPLDQRGPVSLPKSEAFATVDPDAELVEDDDGAPLPPEQQPCPECRAGKHMNCPGEIWTELPADDAEAVREGFAPCPCPDQWHQSPIIDSDATI